MQENENYVPYVNEGAYENYNRNVNQGYPVQGQPDEKGTRAASLCLSFGIVSLCLVVGNWMVGLIFGILSLVYRGKARKAGVFNGDVKTGYIMGLIGTIMNGIIAFFLAVFWVFYLGVIILAIISEM